MASQRSVDLQTVSQLPTEQLVAVIAEQQRVIDQLSLEQDALQFKLRLDDTTEALLNQEKGFVKKLYRMLLDRLTRRMYQKLVRDIYVEMNRITLQHVNYQLQLTQQVSDEFALMHRKIETALNQAVADQVPGIAASVQSIDPVVVEKLRRVEALLGYTEYRVDFNPDLPKQAGRFPLKGLKRSLKDQYTKFVKFLFKEQRQVNINVLQALQQSHLLNQTLLEQVNTLQTRLDRLEHPSGVTPTPSSASEKGAYHADVLFNSSES